MCSAAAPKTAKQTISIALASFAAAALILTNAPTADANCAAMPTCACLAAERWPATCLVAAWPAPAPAIAAVSASTRA